VAYFLPLYFQIVLQASPLETGVWMLSLAIPLAIVSLASGYIMNMTGRYLEVLRVGMALMALGVGLLISFTPYRSWAQIIGFLIVLGIGFGPNFHAPLIALQTRIQERDMASGTATFGFVRMVSGAIGVVLGQVVFQSQMRTHLSEFIAIGVSKSLADELAGGDAISVSTEMIRLPSVQRGYIIGTMTKSLRGTWIFYTIVGVIGFLVSFGIIREKLSRDVPGAKASNQVDARPFDVEKG
jgi:fucose permease